MSTLVSVGLGAPASIPAFILGGLLPGGPLVPFSRIALTGSSTTTLALMGSTVTTVTWNGSYTPTLALPGSVSDEEA